jgi:hypothetical protein
MRVAPKANVQETSIANTEETWPSCEMRGRLDDLGGPSLRASGGLKQ